MRYLPRLLGSRGSARGAAAALVAALALTHASSAQAGAFARSAHGDAGLLPMGCGSCHVGHGSPQTTMMAGSQDLVCLSCHGDTAGRAAAQGQRLLTRTAGLANVAAGFRKLSRHPLNETGPSPRRRVSPRARGGVRGAANTVSCIDCHDAHYMTKARPQSRRSATRPKEIRDARGRSQPEYRLCYDCHGSGVVSARGREDIERLLRRGNPSFHPVEAPGRGTEVPSLVQPYSEHSVIACTDCHGSDQPDGPRGPHGSAFEPLLKARFEREDGRPESPYEYALCYRCHNRSVVLSPASFPEHRRHVAEARASCRTCHDSHGSPKYTHLIDFDTQAVFGNSAGQLRFDDRGTRRGACSLRCHGRDHQQEEY